MSAASHPVILFDGVCNLCHGAVRFIIAHDSAARFRFASLQSAEARRQLALLGFADSLPGSVVLIENGRMFTRSTAVLRIARRLSGWWPLGFGLMAVPRVWRDALYDFIAQRRYRWFGRQDACLLPTPSLQERFLG